MRRIPFLLVAMASALMVMSASAFAAAGRTTVSPSNTSLPTISGTTQTGQTLTAASGSWDGATPISYAYQWQACTASGSACADIAGATGRSYLVGTSQIGSELRATVTATNSAGKASASSNLTAAVIAKASSSPVNTNLPLISGSATVGHTLQSSTGVWTGLSTNGFAYQWSRCNLNGTSCASILGANKQSYGVGQVDLGNALRVSVTATNSTGSTSATSAASGVGAGLVVRAGFSATLRTGQEVSRPSRTPSGAAGHFTAKLVGKTLSWTLTFTHLSGRPTIAGLNKGVRGTNGVAFKTLCRSCLSPKHGTLTLTASQVDAMLRGQTYVNIHTLRNRLGEIRGQITRVS